MLDKIESKTVHNDEEGDQERKKNKTLSELTQVKNKSKNLLSFLEISPLKKEVLPSHKLQDHAYEY